MESTVRLKARLFELLDEQKDVQEELEELRDEMRVLSNVRTRNNILEIRVTELEGSVRDLNKVAESRRNMIHDLVKENRKLREENLALSKSFGGVSRSRIEKALKILDAIEDAQDERVYF